MIAAPIRKLGRLEQAFEIRDHVLSFLHEAGNVTEIGGIKFLTWDGGPWRFSLRIDQLPSPTAPIGQYTDDALVVLQDLKEEQSGVKFDHALGIWRGPKVFLAEWNTVTPSLLNIASFKRGTWEIAVLAFKRQDPNA